MSTEFTRYNYADDFGNVRKQEPTDISGAFNTSSETNTQPSMQKINYILIVSVAVACLAFGLIISLSFFGGMAQVRNNIDRAESWIENACGSGLTEQVKIIRDGSKTMAEKYKTPYVSKYSNAKCIIPKK